MTIRSRTDPCERPHGQRPHPLARRAASGLAVVALLVPVTGAAQAAAAAPSALPGAAPTADAPTADVPTDAPGGHDDDTVLVRFRPVLTEPGQERVVAGSGASLGEDVGVSGWTRVDTAGRDPEHVRAELARDPAVAEAELDPVRTTLATPDDPLYARQAGLGALRLPAAWDVTTGSASTVIAVLDTGVDARHPDLAGRVLPGTDVVNRDGDPADDNGHGTGVAGAAAANTGNGVGVAGVDWKARVLPVKVLGSGGYGRDSDIAEGMRWAVDRGATVINLSLGGGDRSGVLTDAVEYALGRGVVVVAAAGNTGVQEESFPAAIPGVVAVAATDSAGAPARFSTSGPWVDVAAPGTGVATLGLSSSGPSYVAMTGTSFAAPLVSGVVGLVQARHPDWGPARVHDWLRSTARDVAAPGFDTRTGAGVVDAAAAVASSPVDAAVDIAALHARLGGPRSVLGAASTGVLLTPDGVGRYTHYERGSIYWTPTTGAHEVYGSIRERWARLGWERSPLGYPLTGELPTPDGRGRYTRFQGGSVYWTPETGAQEVLGAVLDRWAALRWEAGPLGFPRTGQLVTPDGRGRYNHFQAGSIYWTPQTGAHAVYGAIRVRWAALGWEAGVLGYPTRSEYDVPGGRATDFERGRLTWSRATGAVIVTVR